MRLDFPARAPPARPWRGALAGAGVGLALFLLEAVWVVRGGAAGLLIDTEGPFAAVLAAVRPLLPWLLARVVLAYVGAGAVLGLAAALLVHALGVEGRWARRALFVLELLAIAAVLCWERAIARPALFDDVGWMRGPLGLLVDGGDPWEPRAALAGLFVAHLAVAWKRRGRSWRPLALVPAMLLILAPLPPLPMGEGKGEGTRTPTERNEAPAAPPRLILLFGIDAFRPDRLRANGGTGEVAPNLESFLADATRFDRAYTPIAQTEPAWRSLLTARWPTRTGVRYPLTAEERWAPLPTLATELDRAGFRTAFATDCSRFHHQGESSGFSERHQPPRGAINFALEKLRFRTLGVVADNAVGARLLPELIDNRALAGIHDPYGYARRLADRIASSAESGPALFAFHATAAHFPGDPVYPHYRRFVSPSEPLGRRLRMHFAPIRGGAASARDGWGRAQSEALYDELLSQADAQLGIVLGELKDRGLYDRALIVVFSDHGESFHGDMPALSGATPVHGARLGDEENRILLAIKPPGGRRVESVASLVRLVDLAPTVLELAGAEPLPETDGVSLAPLLRGGSLPPLRLYAETGFTHASPDAFDPEHLARAPRTFEAYQVRPDGVVEMTPAAHDGVMAEKDVGAFDGASWLIRAPMRDGTVRERCVGPCDDPTLPEWLDAQAGSSAAQAARPLRKSRRP